ncbi:MAG: tetratricopeptide repeat protein [Bacteroidota bacterium]
MTRIFLRHQYLLFRLFILLLLGAQHFAVLGASWMRENDSGSTGDWEFTAEQLLRLGKEYTRNQPESAIQEFEKVITLAREQGDSVWVAEGLIQMGIVAYYQDDFGTSNSLYYQALQVVQGQNLPGLVGRIHNNIAWNHERARDYERAVYHYRRGVRLLKQSGDSAMLAWTYNNLGIYYKDVSQYDSALYFLGASLDLHEALGQDQKIGFNLNNTGVIYLYLDRPDTSLTFFRRALALNMMLSDSLEMINNVLNIADAHLALGNYRLAKDTLMAYTPVMDRKGNAHQHTNWLRLMVLSYKGMAEYQKALDTQTQLLALKDSLHSGDLHETMQELETQYGVQKQQAELEDSYQVITQQRFRLFILIFVLLVLVVLLILFIRMYRIKQKKEQELKASNEMISAQAQELSQNNVELAEKNQIIEHQNGELSVLSESLREVNQQLKNHNSELEAAVKERTLALEKSNAKLVDINRRLARSNSELDTFLYKSSHDIARPISSLAGLVELARGVKNQREQDLLWEKVSQTAKGMKLLVRQLQVVHQISKNQEEPTRVNLKEIIAEAKDEILLHRPQARWKWVEPLPEDGSWQMAPTLLKALLICLLENSWDFRNRSLSAPPRIVLRFQESATHWCLHYHDDGTGMPEEIQEKVFTMFYRGSPLSRGNGLGLFIVSRIVEMLEGKSSLQSDVGQGASFSFHFPKDAPAHHSVKFPEDTLRSLMASS